jgi:hypothetical protein
MGFFSCSLFGDDLFQGLKCAVVALRAHPVSDVDPLLRLADQAAVALIEHAPFALLWHRLQALQLVRDLPAPKERLENDAVPSGHNLGNLVLHKAI